MQNLISNYRELYLSILKLQTTCLFVCVLKTCCARHLWPCCFEYSNLACMFEIFYMVIVSVYTWWHDHGLAPLCWCSIGCFNCWAQIMLQHGNNGVCKIWPLTTGHYTWPYQNFKLHACLFVSYWHDLWWMRKVRLFLLSAMLFELKICCGFFRIMS